jgi:uncharacterized protein YbcI
MSNHTPTYRQIERDLSQKIKALYNAEINYSPKEITCKLFSRYLAIVADETLSPLEKNLWQQGQIELIEQIRQEIAFLFRPKLIKIIEDIVGTEIVEILGDVVLSNNRSGILVVLSESPRRRNFILKNDRKL